MMCQCGCAKCFANGNNMQEVVAVTNSCIIKVTSKYVYSSLDHSGIFINFINCCLRHFKTYRVWESNKGGNGGLNGLMENSDPVCRFIFLHTPWILLHSAHYRLPLRPLQSL
jgi:hypothetical protein